MKVGKMIELIGVQLRRSYKSNIEIDDTALAYILRDSSTISTHSKCTSVEPPIVEDNPSMVIAFVSLKNC